ncbi:MAG: galactosyltransferase-related protein [Nocardiopsaceae bacterium]|nr:galactosyltransferase-related protein [Nocardiopsaceae bacterium]
MTRNSVVPEDRFVGTPLGVRLAQYAVLANDPSVPEIAADWWKICEPHYRSVVEPLAAATDGDRSGEDLARLAAAPSDESRERALADSLGDFLERFPDTASRMAGLVAAADPHLLIDYRRGARPDPPAAEVDLATVLAWRPPPAEQSAAVRTVVVIPFRDRTNGARTRNLLACLASLRAQRRRVDDVTVTVVESDDEPRWEEAIRPWVDHYVFARHSGHFNKSWAVNVGVRQTPGTPELICMLDADVLVDELFLERNLARAERGGPSSFLPYQDMFCLDAASSHAAIRRRCEQGAPDVPLDSFRALILREPPGANLWVRADVFHRIGGFDERYTGWGGEDDDMVARLVRAGGFARFADPLLHLSHPRPQMTLDGAPFNAHIEPGSWDPGHGYGQLHGPAAAAAAGRP